MRNLFQIKAKSYLKLVARVMIAPLACAIIFLVVSVSHDYLTDGKSKIVIAATTVLALLILALNKKDPAQVTEQDSELDPFYRMR